MIRSQPENGTRRIVPSLRGARIGFLSLLPVIAAAALLGRKIERAYPVLIFVLPYTGFLFLLRHAAVLALLCVRAPEPAASGRRNATLILGICVCPLLFVVLSEAFIQMPIERIHLLKYGLLGYFLPFALNLRTPQRVIAGFVLAACAGLAEETSQLWIPERRFDPRDVMMNVLSAALGSMYAALVSSADRVINGNSE